MRLFKVFIGLLVVLGLVLILIQNRGEVSVDLLFVKFTDVDIPVVLVVTIAIGIVIGFGIAATSILTAKNEARIAKIENRRLTGELHSLRNIAVDEGLLEVTDEEEDDFN
ncbi:MAG: LapA family protein [Fidelibacterota bacterium]